MKRILAIAVVLLSFPAAALADGLRSGRHFVKIDVQSVAGASRQYNVQVFDAESRNHLAHLKVVAKGDTSGEAETAAGGTQYKVRIASYGEAYLVEFTANDGTEVIDTLRGGFTTAAKPQTPRNGAVRGGRDVKEPKVLRRIEPVYTEEAKAAGAAGAVVLEVTIDRSGFVRDAAVMLPMGHGLSESAVEAVKQWQFEPSLRQGVPVEVVQEVRVDFKP